MRYFKRLTARNYLYLPDIIVKNFGREYYLEVRDNEIVLVPIKKRG